MFISTGNNFQLQFKTQYKLLSILIDICNSNKMLNK